MLNWSMLRCLGLDPQATIWLDESIRFYCMPLILSSSCYLVAIVWVEPRTCSLAP
jgi:hypothetical protein